MLLIASVKYVDYFDLLESRDLVERPVYWDETAYL